jgi:phospholipid/cholesterol/gamma-HCH transport system permease protein
LLVRLSGSWTLQSDRPTVAELQQQIDAAGRVQRLTFETSSLTGWDSGLVTFLRNVEEVCRSRRLSIDRGGLPEGVRRLLDLATAVPERQEARRGEAREPLLARIGTWGIGVVEAASNMLRFIGEAILAFLQLLRGRASFRWSDLFLLLQ